MKYNFSAQFLKILPPDTSFGDAWDSFCLSLLQQEGGFAQFLSLKAPDRGVDILQRSGNVAIQCKSDERGALGSLAPTASVESLKTAVQHKSSIGWDKYLFATNARYSGDGIEKIFSEAKKLGLNTSDIEFLGPEYWSDLCGKHLDSVNHYLDYRLTYTESEVKEAFRKARYYDERIEKCIGLISTESIAIEVANNRTPIILSIPFARDLTVRECLDVAKSLLGLTLNIERYSDLGSSAKPRISLALDEKPQPFEKKLGEFSVDELKKLKVWIQTVYSLDENARGNEYAMYELAYKEASSFSRTEAKSKTVERFNRSIEDKMWNSVTNDQ